MLVLELLNYLMNVPLNHDSGKHSTWKGPNGIPNDHPILLEVLPLIVRQFVGRHATHRMVRNRLFFVLRSQTPESIEITHCFMLG